MADLKSKHATAMKWGGTGLRRYQLAVSRSEAVAELFKRLLHRRPIIEENPFDHRYWQAAVFDQVVMELAEPEVFPLFVLVAAEQIHDLPFAGDVADLLRRTRCGAGSFPFC